MNCNCHDLRGKGKGQGRGGGGHPDGHTSEYLGTHEMEISISTKASKLSLDLISQLTMAMVTDYGYIYMLELVDQYDGLASTLHA